MDPRLEALLFKFESGKINCACVYQAIDTYYQCVIDKTDELGDADDINEDAPFPEEFLLPVEDRQSGIGVVLTRLLDAGYNVDGTDGSFNALMLAVGEGDAPMVRFLLDHGADANSWPDMGEEPALGEGNYYLNDIDIHFMNESFATDADINYLKALHSTALVLAEEAHLGPYSGYSLKIDNDGHVTLGPAKVLF